MQAQGFRAKWRYQVDEDVNAIKIDMMELTILSLFIKQGVYCFTLDYYSIRYHQPHTPNGWPLNPSALKVAQIVGMSKVCSKFLSS